MTTTITVGLKQLDISALNVRTNVEDATGVDELAASIKSVGLLQSPVVVEKKGRGAKRYDVIAGGRRVRALQLLVERGDRPADMSLDVVLYPDREKATEASLAENYARKQMRPSEIYRAFAAIKAERPTATIEDLAAMFSFDTARTARIMRLANLSPKVMDAYAAGLIDDGAAQAYAGTEDHALMDRAFDEMDREQSHRPHSIRKALGAMSRDTKQILSIVGLQAYREAGGTFEQDLFQSEGDGILKDPALLDRLFENVVADFKDRFEHQLSRNGRVVGEKWGIAALDFEWRETPPQIKQYGYESTDHELRLRNPKRSAFTSEQKANVEQYNATIAGLKERMEKVGEDNGDDVDELTAEQEKELDEIERLIERHHDMIASIESTRTTILPKKGKVVGVITIVGSEGNERLEAELWYASRADKGVAMPAGAKAPAGAKTVSAGEAERKREGLTKDGHFAMAMLFRDMVGAQLLHTAEQGSMIALDVVLFTQAWSLLYATEGYGAQRYTQGLPVGILSLPQDDGRPTKVANMAATFSIDTDFGDQAERLKTSEPFAAEDPIEGFRLFRSAPDDLKNRVAAYVAAHLLIASTSYYNDAPTRPRMLNAIAQELDNSPDRMTSWKDMVTLDEHFFEKLSHKRRCAILTEWGLDDRAKVEKAATSAAFCARVQEAATTGDDRAIAALGIAAIDLDDVAMWLPSMLDQESVTPFESKKAEAEPDDGEVEDEQLADGADDGEPSPADALDAEQNLADNAEVDPAEEDARRRQEMIDQLRGGRTDEASLDGGELARTDD